MILSSCSSTGARYRIAGNFWGWKLSQLLTFCGYSKVFSVKFVGVVSFGGTSKQSRKVFFFFFVWNSYFHQFVKAFSRERFPLYGISVCIIHNQVRGITIPTSRFAYCNCGRWEWQWKGHLVHIVCMHTYVLSQTGNDAELLVPELLKHVTDIQLEKYQVLQSQVYMFFVLHVLATLVASAIA